MKLATITNWAYGATVLLTLVSGGTMLLASRAQENEREAVTQRYSLDNATARLSTDLFSLTGQIRQYVIDGDPSHLIVYEREYKDLQSVEQRIRHVKDAGATAQEMAVLAQAFHWVDTLHDEQQASIEAYKAGRRDEARKIVFGAEYERELERTKTLLERFQYQLDGRTAATIAAATNVAKIWRVTSEITLSITALLFFCVLYFLFKKRVLRPVVKLSDVISRLAVQDYAVIPPEIDQVDEIGDMAHAIRIFRENGLERQRLERERDADVATRELLARMTQRMQGCDTQSDLEEVIRCFVPEIAPNLAGSLYLLDDERNVMVGACDWLSPVHSLDEFAPIKCWALRRGVVHQPAGGTIDIPCEHVDADGDQIVRSICLPLVAQRETFGLLYLEPRGDEQAGTPRTPEIYLNILAENIGLALANLRLRNTLRKLAMSDALTGLGNRRALVEVFDRKITETEREGRPFSCLVVDVDHFKRFNDEFGHEAGDTVLGALGDLLDNATREVGMAFRYGGEEFVLLMPDVASEHARERAEDIRMSIAELSLEHRQRALGRITVSIGLATSPDHCCGKELMQAADAALFRAKNAGRNRIMVADRRGGARETAISTG